MILNNDFFLLEGDEIKGYNSLAYSQYFYDEIQIFEDTFAKKKSNSTENNSHDRFSKGITFVEYYSKLLNQYKQDENDFLKDYNTVLTDKRLIQLQKELMDEGLNICMLNILYLSKFIIDKCMSYKYMIMKPQIADTLSEINDVKEIVFINKDGSKARSNNNNLIKKITELLEQEKDNNEYEVKYEFLSIDKLSNKEFIQIYFIHDMTMFLNSYFKVARRKNALISSKEQELVIYLMFILNLTPAEVSNSRYRQLLSKYDKIHPHINLCNFHIGADNIQIHCAFLKYKLWKNGKIDWTDSDIESGFLKNGDYLIFTKE